MMIISFGWTWPALVFGPKRCTRRDWTPRYAAMFHKDDLVSAWDKSPRIGGKRVATVRLLRDPHLEPVSEMPDSDYALEGFEWIYSHPEYVPKRLFNRPCTRADFSPAGFENWRQSGRLMWVVRYEVEEVVKNA